MLIPKKSLGQNFLVDKNIAKKIVNLAKNICENNIIEIGPGKGALTDEIIKKKPKNIILIEKDKSLYEYLLHKYKNINNIKILNIDAITYDYSIIEKPKTLSNLMVWSDFTISASGLTKYLLAATGTPSILISIDKEHAEINRTFNDINSSYHIGILDEISVHKIAKEIKNLIISKEHRVAMSNAGNRAINANGNIKLVDEFIKYY